jgi:hypothetical protein
MAMTIEGTTISESNVLDEFAICTIAFDLRLGLGLGAEDRVTHLGFLGRRPAKHRCIPREAAHMGDLLRHPALDGLSRMIMRISLIGKGNGTAEHTHVQHMSP